MYSKSACQQAVNGYQFRPIFNTAYENFSSIVVDNFIKHTIQMFSDLMLFIIKDAEFLKWTQKEKAFRDLGNKGVDWVWKLEGKGAKLQFMTFVCHSSCKFI